MQTNKKQPLPSNHELWKEQFNSAVSFLKENYGWKVKLNKGKECEADPVTQTVSINKNLTPRNQFYMLLHEIGHVVLFHKPWYHEKYGKWDGKYTLSRRVILIEEELQAWKQGEKLAKRLNLMLDKQYEVLMGSKVASYCLWATHRKHPWEGFSRRT